MGEEVGVRWPYAILPLFDDARMPNGREERE